MSLCTFIMILSIFKSSFTYITNHIGTYRAPFNMFQPPKHRHSTFPITIYFKKFNFIGGSIYSFTFFIPRYTRPIATHFGLWLTTVPFNDLANTIQTLNSFLQQIFVITTFLFHHKCHFI